MSAELQAWRRQGGFFLWRGHRIFMARGGHGPCLLLIHGYPTGSFDWHRMWRGLGEHFDLIAPDLLGLGYSDKPHAFCYSLADHADMIEDLLDHAGCSRVHVMAHDLGVSVAQELLARQIESRRRCTIESLVLLNGGLCPEAYTPRFIQRLLASRIGAWLGPRVPRWAFDRSIRTLFGPHAATSSDSLLEDFWSLVEHNQGLRVAHVVGRFWVDRMERRDRLLAPLLASAVPTRLINGGADPNSGRHMAQRYRALVPQADIVSLGEVGHWPQLEAPQAVLDATLSFFDSRVSAGSTPSSSRLKPVERTP